MKIKPNETVRRSLIKKYWTITRRTLAVCRLPIIEKAAHVDGERLKGMVRDLFDKNKLSPVYVNLWSESGGKFANDMTNVLLAKGDSGIIEMKKDPDQLTLWKERYRKYASERSAAFVETVTDTQVDLINAEIDKVLERSLTEGLSVDKTRKLMQEQLSGSQMLEMENYQAERIARTEVIGASNKGSFDAANEMGLTGIKKTWLTSGLPKVRPSHMSYEGMGAVSMDYQYNTGLKFPGDPGCDDPADTINCRCTIIYEVD